jgi:hypothetical protein
MASKPINQHFVNHTTGTKGLSSAEDLRCAFETAVCELQQADRAAKKGARYRMPIVARGRILGTKASAEKRALTDAARALAQLWKV